MTTPTEELIADAKKARADFEVAHAEASRLLAPPDPLIVLAEVIADSDDLRAERDEWKEKCDALTADLNATRTALDAVRKEHELATEAIGHLRERRRELKDEVERLTTSLATAEADATTQRTAADNLRAALDRVATAAGVDTDSTGAIVADRVIKELCEAGRAGLAVEQCRTIKDAADILFRDAVSPGAPSADRRSDLGSALLAIAAGRADKTEARPTALPADLRTYLETRRDRLQGGHGLGLAAEIAALNRWLALPTADATGGGR